MQAMENSNSQRTKEALKNALEDMIEAEHIMVEKINDKLFVYDKSQETIFRGYKESSFKEIEPVYVKIDIKNIDKTKRSITN